MLGLLALAACTLAADVPFHYSGPMTKLLSSGAKIAPVSEGLPFEIVISSGGSVGPSSFKLSSAGWSGAADLSFSGLGFSAGTLTGEATLTNGTGASLQGLRLDILSAVEQYKAKDEEGKDVVRARSQPFGFESPLFFGDLLNRESEGPHNLRISNLKVVPETIQISVRGVISGLRFSGQFQAPDGGGYSSMDFDSSGKLIADLYGEDIFVVEPPREGRARFKVEGQCTGVAVDPKSGEVYATTVSSPKVTIFSPDGKVKATLGEQNGIDKFVQRLRFGKDGRLYAQGDGGSNLFVIQANKVVKSIEEAAGVPLAVSSFDVSPTGFIWLTDAESRLIVIAPDGKGRIAAKQVDWKFGAVQSPLGIRVSPKGHIYVGEEEVDNYDPFDRISVFDSEGRILRVFGRGGKKPAGADDQLNQGQVESPREMAFAPDGTLYVSASGAVLVFKPF